MLDTEDANRHRKVLKRAKLHPTTVERAMEHVDQVVTDPGPTKIVRERRLTHQKPTGRSQGAKVLFRPNPIAWAIAKEIKKRGNYGRIVAESETVIWVLNK